MYARSVHDNGCEKRPLAALSRETATILWRNGHPDIATDLHNLARLLQATNRLADAELMMHRHLEIFLKLTRNTRRQHPHLIDALNNYYSLLMQTGDTDAKAMEKISAMLTAYGLSLG